VQQYKIRHGKSTPYHPQANDQVKLTDKVLEGILTKTVQLHQADWAEKLSKALWDYRTTWKMTTGYTPYELVDGNKILLPIEFVVNTYKILLELGINFSEDQQQ